jgi:hypothetical protein
MDSMPYRRPPPARQNGHRSPRRSCSTHTTLIRIAATTLILLAACEKKPLQPRPRPTDAADQTPLPTPPQLPERPALPPERPPTPAPPKPATAPAVPPPLLTDQRTLLDGISFSVPQGWERIEPRPNPNMPAGLRPKAVYRLSTGPADRLPVQVRVTQFPEMGRMDNLVQANLDRWCGVFTGPDGQSAIATRDVETFEIGPCRITVVQITGDMPTIPDRGMVGAIIEHPRGPFFIKAHGAAEGIQRWRESIHAYIKSVRAAPEQPAPEVGTQSQ